MYLLLFGSGLRISIIFGGGGDNRVPVPEGERERHRPGPGDHRRIKGFAPFACQGGGVSLEIKINLYGSASFLRIMLSISL